MLALTEVAELVGKRIDSSDVTTALESLPEIQSETITRPSTPDVNVYSLRGGFSLRHTLDGEVRAIFLHGEERAGFSLYAGSLPRGLTLDATSEAIVERMGPPSLARPAQRDASWWAWLSKDPGPAAHGELLRYDSLFCSLHFTMRLDGAGIALVTIMDPRAVP